MASRTLILASGLILAACGSQPQSATATNAAAEAASASPSTAPMERDVVATPSAATNAQDYTIDRSNKTGSDLIRDILVKSGTLDGARITEFELRGRCQTVVTTAAGTTTIDWSKVADWAARLEGNQRIIPIDDGNGTHAIGVNTKPPSKDIGDPGALVESGFGVMADNCHS